VNNNSRNGKFEEKVLRTLGYHVGKQVEVRLKDEAIYGKLAGYGYDCINPLIIVLEFSDGGQLMLNFNEITWIRFSKK